MEYLTRNETDVIESFSQTENYKTLLKKTNKNVTSLHNALAGLEIKGMLEKKIIKKMPGKPISIRLTKKGAKYQKAFREL